MQHSFTLLKLKQFAPFLAIGLLLSLAACFGSKGGSTLGNGQVDAVEAATLRVAVGLAMTARPDTVAPAHAVATALLAVLADDSQPVPALAIEQTIIAKLGELDLDPASQQSFNDLMLLIKARIMEQLAIATQGSNRIVVVRDIIEIVRETATARLDPTALADSQ